MQTQGGQAAANAVERRERQFNFKLLVDWGRTGQFDHPLSDLTPYVDKTSLDRHLKGSTPEEVTLVAGASAAEFTATLSGEFEGQSMVQVFAAYSGRSVFYLQQLEGCAVSYSVTLHTDTGPVEYPQFEGQVRSTTPVRADGTVELSALDRVEVLRRPVRFPQWAVLQRLTEAGIVDSQMTYSHWVIDHCLRQCDTSPTGIRHTTRQEIGAQPDWKDGVHYWGTGNGSIMPTRGWMDNAEIQRFPDTEGGEPEMYDDGLAGPDAEPSDPLPLAFNGVHDDTTDGFENRFWAQDRDLMDAYGAHFLRCTILDDGSGYLYNSVVKQIIEVNIGEKVLLRLLTTQGAFTQEFKAEMFQKDTGDTWAVSFEPLVSPPYDMFAEFDTSGYQSGNVSIWLDVNGNNTGWTDVGNPAQPSSSDDPTKGLVKLHRRLTLQDVAWAFRNYFNASDTPGEPNEIRRIATYRAALDRGINRLSFAPPDLDGEDAWNVITAVAAAEWGSVWWDETGVFRFWNYDTMRAKQNTVVRRFSIDDVEDWSARRSLDSVRNVFSVEARKKASVMGTIIEAEDENEYIVPGNSTKQFLVWDQSLVSPYPYKVDRYTTIPNESYTSFPQWNDGEGVTVGYVVQFLIGGTWQEDNSKVDGVDIYAFWAIDGHMVIDIQNGYNIPSRLATDTGKPALKIRGTYTTQNDPQVFETRDDASINSYGERNLKLSGPWYQDRFDYADLISRFIDRTTEPVPITDDFTVPGDPRTQLGDTVEVVDPQGFGESLKLQIVGKSTELDPEGDGLTDKLTAELIRPPGRWVLGSEAFSVLGRSTILTDTTVTHNVDSEMDSGTLEYWGSYVGDLTVNTDPQFTYQDQTYSLKLTPDGTSSIAVVQYNPIHRVPAIVGESFKVYFSMYSPNGYTNANIQVVWLDEDRATLDTFNYDFSIPADDWWFAWATRDVPDGAAWVIGRFYLDGTPSTSDVTYLNFGRIQTLEDA